MKYALLALTFALLSPSAFANDSRLVGSCVEKVEKALMTADLLGGNYTISVEDTLSTDGGKMEILFYRLPENRHTEGRANIELEILKSTTEDGLTDVEECNVLSVNITQ